MKLLAFRALCFGVLAFCLPVTFSAGVQWDQDGSVHPANRLNPHFRNLMVTSNTTLRQLTVTNTITAGGLVVTAPTFSSFANSPHNHQNAAGGAQLNASSVFSTGTIPTARLGSGTANSTTFLRGDSTWQVPGGGGIGDVVGPSSATNDNLVRFDTTTGKLVQDSSVNVEDDGDILTPGSVSAGVGSSVAGSLVLGEGTAPGLTADAITYHAPASVASGGVNYVPSGTAGTGFQLWTDSSGVMAGSIIGFTGFGDVARATSPTISDPIITSTLFFNGLVFTIEGAVSDANETLFEFGEPSGDATYEFDTARMATPGVIDLGHISDTTVARAASGFLSVEGKRIASPASAAAGDTMYFDGTEWVRLPKGLADQVLQMNAGATAPEWDTVGGSSTPTDVQIYTSIGPNTWTKPANAKFVDVILIGGGGGGGSGRRGAAGSARVGGGGGGGGAMCRQRFSAALLGATETVTVGGGGPGAAAQTVDTSNGTTGSTGTNTTFGAWLSGDRGRGGSGGQDGAGGGPGSAGSGESSGGGGGTASTTGLLGGNGTGTAVYGAGGGGAGGGVTSADAVSNGGSGGSSGTAALPTAITGGSAGTAGGNGGTGGSVTANQPQGGAGAGGGASSITGVAGSGGNGGTYGAGGGGGGASLNGNNSGAGGNGANGLAIVVTYF